MADGNDVVNTDSGDPRPRGGCLKRSCGCGAFFLGGVVVLVALAPRIAGGLVARVVEAEFEEQQAGSLEIPSTELRWTSRQRLEDVRLFDPEGREVAEVSLELPSIADLVEAWSRMQNGGVVELGHYQVSLEADVVVDEEGRTNLEAALAPKRRHFESDVIIHRPRREEPTDRETEDLLRRIELVVELDCSRLTWTDPRLDVEGQQVALHDVLGELRLAEGGTMTLELAGEQECETRGPFSLEMGMAGFSAAHEMLPSTWQLQLSAANLSGALVDRLSELEGEVGTLLGDTFAVDAAMVGAFKEPQRADFELRSEALRLAAVGELSGGTFALVDESTVIELAPLVAAERVRAWSEEVLPEGMSIEVPPEGLPLEVRELTFAMPFDSEDPLRDAKLEISLALGPFGVGDPFRQGSDDVLSLAGLELSLALLPGEAPAARLATGFADRPGSSLVLDVRGEGPLSAARLEEGAEPYALDVIVEAAEIPIDRLRKLAGAEDAWEELWGGRLALHATTRVAEGKPVPLNLELHTDNADLQLEGVLEPERLQLTGDGLTAELRVPKLVFADLLRERMPEKYLLSSRKAVLPLGVRIEELNVDLTALEKEESLLGSSLRLDLELGALDYTEELLASKEQQIALQKSTLHAELFPGGRLSVDLESTLNDKAGGSLLVHLESERGVDLLSGGDPEQHPVTLSARAVGFPTKVVDLYADQDGLLVDVLGPRLDVTVESESLTPSGGPIAAHASSDLGTFEWEGVYRDGVLESGETGELQVTALLSPLLGERVVGPLVPLLVNLQKGDDAPVLLKGRDLRLPLDGDLSGLDGKLRLELGQVTCSLLPGLASELPGFASKAVQNALIQPIDLTIEKGVVRYDRLPVRIDGRPVVFAGGYDLKSGALDLSTDLKLGDIGGEVGRALRSVRKALGENYAVPVHLGGTVKSPRVSLAPGFLERAVEDAGRKAIENELDKALKKGLKDLLGG